MKPYQQMTSLEVKHLEEAWILNGFWGGWQNPIIRFFIWLIMSDFDTAIANFHDYGYWIWWDENRRRHCDEMFYSAIIFDIYQLFLKWKIWKLGVIWKNIIAYLAYLSIRFFGAHYFNYKKHE